MFFRQKDPHGAVRRGQLQQSTMEYWTATRGIPGRHDPLACPAGSPVQSRAGPWVWLVLVILIGLTAVLLVAL